MIRPRFNARHAPIVMALLSIAMTLVVSAVSTLRGVGATPVPADLAVVLRTVLAGRLSDGAGDPAAGAAADGMALPMTDTLFGL